jgi:hypothetical protein
MALPLLSLYSLLQTTKAEKVDLGAFLDTFRSKVAQNILLCKNFGLSDTLADFLFFQLFINEWISQ